MIKSRSKIIELITELDQSDFNFNDWEQKFIADMHDKLIVQKQWPITSKQANRLIDIKEKYTKDDYYD